MCLSGYLEIEGGSALSDRRMGYTYYLPRKCHTIGNSPRGRSGAHEKRWNDGHPKLASDSFTRAEKNMLGTPCLV